MKKIKRFSEHIYPSVINSFKELSKEIEEYDYILGDEGYEIDIRQFHVKMLTLFIKPKLQSEIDRYNKQSSISQSLFILNADKYFQIFPWSDRHKKVSEGNISVTEILYNHIKDKEFFEEWLDRVSEICESSGYKIELNTNFREYIGDGVVFHIGKKQ
jgi:hypothetical protein